VIPVKSTRAQRWSAARNRKACRSVDRVYGSGFYVAHVLGAVLYARAVITGTEERSSSWNLQSESGRGSSTSRRRERQQRQPLQTDSKRSLTRPRAGSDEFQEFLHGEAVSAMIARSSGF